MTKGYIFTMLKLFFVILTSADVFADAVKVDNTSASCLISISGVISHVKCNGSATGSIALTVTGGAAPYTFSWSGPGGFTSTVEDISSISAGTYSVTVTDAAGCFSSSSFTVTQPAVLTSSMYEDDANCNSHSGKAVVTPSGGTPPYTYMWSTGNKTESNNGLFAGTYFVRITDAKGCTVLDTAVITNSTNSSQTNIAASVSSTNVTCGATSNGTATAVATNTTTGVKYEWSNGATTSTITGLTAGLYSVLITSSDLCAMVYSVNVEKDSTLSSTGTQQNVLCNGDATGSASIIVSGSSSSYTYNWSPNVSSTSSASSLPAGSYTVVATDGSGCKSYQEFNITEPAELVLSTLTPFNTFGFNISCKNGNDGSLTAIVTGGAGGYSYSWSGPGGFSASGEQLSNLAAGSYTLNVTDANGCKSNTTVTLTEPDLLTVAISAETYAGGYNISCNGLSDGSLILTTNGGASPYDLTATNGSGDTIFSNSGLSAGLYNVAVTDALGCTASSSITLTEPPALTSGATVSFMNGYNISCNGSDDGTIVLNGSGGTSPLAVAWSGPGSFTSGSWSIKDLGAGTYSYIITDANNCTSKGDVQLLQPDLLNVTIDAFGIMCNGSNEGTVSAVVTGGVASYKYSWSTPTGSESSSTLNNAGAGSYSVIVTDANGCKSTASLEVTQPEKLTATYTVSSFNGFGVSCNTSSDGSISLAVNGGTLPYTYMWTGPNGFDSGSKDLSALSAGVYTVVVSDANDCNVQYSISVTEPAALVVDISSSSFSSGTNVSCSGAANGQLSAEVAGGVKAYSYQWSSSNGFSSTSNEITGLEGGSYFLTVIDGNGCTASSSIKLNEPEPLIVDMNGAGISGFDILCNGENTGEVKLSIGGGTAPYTYSWTSSNGFVSKDRDLQSVPAGLYSVTVKDANGCELAASVEVKEPEKLVASVVSADVKCFGARNGEASVSVTGGVPPYSYQWNNGITNPVNPSLAPGTYEVLVKDFNGCETSGAVKIAEPEKLVLMHDKINPSCKGVRNGSISVEVFGGVTPYYYDWSNGDDKQDQVNLDRGDYSLTVIDANMCKVEGHFNLTYDYSLIADIEKQDVSCHHKNDGRIALAVTSGMAPFEINWNNGSNADVIEGLGSGVYSVAIKDKNGCLLEEEVTISEPPALTVEVTAAVQFNGHHVSTWQGSDGSVSVIATGGTEPYVYVWDNGANSADLQSLRAGTYSLICTDGNGCEALANISLTQPPAIELPTGYSPNGDGSNETFYVRGLEAYPENTLTVINRWGNEVFVQKDYRNDWNGVNSEGKQLPEGTYFVFLKAGGITYSGYVDIRR